MTKITKTTYDFDVAVQGMPPSTLADIALGKAPLPMQAVQAGSNPPSAKPSPEKSASTPEKAKESPSSSKASSPKEEEKGKGDKDKGDKGKEDKTKDKKKKKKKKKDKKDSSSSSSSSSSSDSSSDSSDGEDLRRSRGVRRALEAYRYPLYSPSASYRQLDTIACSHQYTISGYSLARAMGCGTRLCSDLFEAGGQMFRLEVYPAGFTADTRKHVSVFLTTPGALNPNHVLFEIAILDQSGKDKHIVATSSDGGKHHHHGPLLTYQRGIVGAVLRLAKSKVLEEKRKRYLPHDMLVLRATVHVLSGWSSAPAIHGHITSSLQSPMWGLGSGSYASASMQGLVMPGTGLGPSNLQPVQMMPAAQPGFTLPAVSMVTSPRSDLAGSVYGGWQHGGMAGGSYQQPQAGLSAYAVPAAGPMYAAPPLPTAPWVAQTTQWMAPPVYNYGPVPLA